MDLFTALLAAGADAAAANGLGLLLTLNPKPETLTRGLFFLMGLNPAVFAC